MNIILRIFYFFCKMYSNSIYERSNLLDIIYKEGSVNRMWLKYNRNCTAFINVVWADISAEKSRKWKSTSREKYEIIWFGQSETVCKECYDDFYAYWQKSGTYLIHWCEREILWRDF